MKIITGFTNSQNSKTSEPYRLLVNLEYKRKLIRWNKYVAFPNLSIFYTPENIKKLHKNNSKISG